MKNLLIVTCFLICLFGCVDNVDMVIEKPIEKEMNTPLASDNGKDIKVEKYYGLDGKPETMKVMPEGSQLTYNGNGVWYGHFAGSGVHFYGPTPSQIQNGMLSVWQAAPGPVCTGCIVSGDGDYFLVQQPGCVGGAPIKHVTMLHRTEKKSTPSSPTSIIVWAIVQRATVRLSGTDCSIQAYGRIVIDEQCNPVIVTVDSDKNDSCLSGLIPL